MQEIEERKRKVDELERDIASTVESQIRENLELKGNVREMEAYIRNVD